MCLLPCVVLCLISVLLSAGCCMCLLEAISKKNWQDKNLWDPPVIIVLHLLPILNNSSPNRASFIFILPNHSFKGLVDVLGRSPRSLWFKCLFISRTAICSRLSYSFKLFLKTLFFSFIILLLAIVMRLHTGQSGAFACHDKLIREWRSGDAYLLVLTSLWICLSESQAWDPMCWGGGCCG